MQQTVLLIGGMFGVGKSTIASQIKQEYGVNCFNFDFADVYRQKSGVALSQSKQGDQYRDANWADTIIGSVNTALFDGYELIIANSSFLIGDRRRVVLERIYQGVRALSIILAPPLLVPYHRIKIGRSEGTHIVNKGNARQSIHRICNEFIYSDNTDLLLPTDRSQLPKEYLAMLYRNEINRDILFESPDDEVKRAPKWLLVPQDLVPKDFIGLITSEANSPFELRAIIENKMHYNIEGLLSKHELF